MSMLVDLVKDIFQGAGMHEWRGVIFKTWVGKYPVERLTNNEHESGWMRVITFLYKSWTQLLESIFARAPLSPTAASKDAPLKKEQSTSVRQRLDARLQSIWENGLGIAKKLGETMLQRVAWDTVFFLSVIFGLVVTVWIRRVLQRHRHRRLNEYLRRQRSQQRRQQQQPHQRQRAEQ
mmetsp:Transcript_57/g.300  ORF Transcript_57/g.300 Transcript_57/m.300 type:complete len:178 (+) Transcript_57:2940-3473(+)